MAIGSALVAAGLLAVAAGARFDRPRILVVGDSITAQYGPDAAARLRGRGYLVTVRGYPGMGLLDRGPRLDIVPMIDGDLRSAQPDIVVAEFSGNYGLANPPRPGVALASPAYFAAWTQAVAELEAKARQFDASVLWVVPPLPLHNPGPSEQLAAIYAARASRGVAVFDAGPPAHAEERNGDLHAADGTHLSPAGAALVAGLIAGRVHAMSGWLTRVRTLHGPALSVTVIVAIALVLVALLYR